MNENLISLIEEQTFLNFTGRLNVLEREKNMHLGAIFFHEGDVINCEYHNSKGMEALESLFFLEFERTSLKFVIEPEMVSVEVRKIHYPFKTLKKKIESFIEVTSGQHAKAPPMHIRLGINSSIVSNGQSLTSDEFDVLKTICDYNKVEEIYDNCMLVRHKITNALVKLRKKKAIKVIK